MDFPEIRSVRVEYIKLIKINTYLGSLKAKSWHLVFSFQYKSTNGLFKCSVDMAFDRSILEAGQD